MVTKRITEVTVQTDEVLIIRRPESPLPIWCAACAALVSVVTPEEAAALARVSWRTMWHRVEDGKMHYFETPEGRLFICANSLLQSSQLPSGDASPIATER